MFTSQSNKLGQIYVEWDIKTEILRYVSACSVARNSNCPNSTLCTGESPVSTNGETFKTCYEHLDILALVLLATLNRRPGHALEVYKEDPRH